MRFQINVQLGKSFKNKVHLNLGDIERLVYEFLVIEN